MPWDGHEGSAGPAAPSNCRVAVYRRFFILTRPWRRPRVQVQRECADGFATAPHICDNVHRPRENGHTASEFDITEARREQTHDIVAVLRVPSAHG